VEYIATLLCGGDLACSENFQTTITQKYLSDEYILQRRHCRMAFREVGRRLSTYADSWQLVKFIYEALQAHRGAYAAGILHRDISDGNILIDDSKSPPTAFLNDWDLSKPLTLINSGMTQHRRSGTWRFMSAAILAFPRKPHELSDDLESSVHVLVIMLIRFHEQKLPIDRADLESTVQSYFDQHDSTPNGYDIGGRGKLKAITDGIPPIELLDPRAPLSQLLRNLFQMLQQHQIATGSLDHYLPEPRRLDERQRQPIAQSKQLALELPPDLLDDVFVVAATQVPQASKTLDNHNAMLRVFISALKAPGWVEDKGDDNFKLLSPMLYKSLKTKSSMLTRRSESMVQPGDAGHAAKKRKLTQSGTSSAAASELLEKS